MPPRPPARGRRPPASPAPSPRRRTLRPAPAPRRCMRACRPGSVRISIDRATSASRSPGATRNPSCPSRTSSPVPPTSVATTGSPHAIASITTFGRPSQSEVSQNRSALAQQLVHVGALARQRAGVAEPGRLAPRPRPRPRSGPSPTRRKRASGSRARSAAAAATNKQRVLLLDQAADHDDRRAEPTGRGCGRKRSRSMALGITVMRSRWRAVLALDVVLHLRRVDDDRRAGREGAPVQRVQPAPLPLAVARRGDQRAAAGPDCAAHP